MSKHKHIIAGPCGDLEIALDLPLPSSPWAVAPRALALVAHPHPLQGGNMENKVTTTLARVCAGLGCATIRLNYRGVGHSVGSFDHSAGEADDAAAALAWLQAQYPNGAAMPILLGGFSFGTAVAARLAQRIPTEQLLGMVLAGAAVPRFAQVTVNIENTLMVHGELDKTVPLPEIMEWARPQSLPISVVPSADHFFNRQLLPLKQLAIRHYTQCLSSIA